MSGTDRRKGRSDKRVDMPPRQTWQASPVRQRPTLGDGRRHGLIGVVRLFACCATLCGLVDIASWSSAQTAAGDPVGSVPGSVNESWEVIHLQGSKVGFGHTTQSHRQIEGRDCLETVSESQLTVKRFGQTVRQDVRLSSVDTVDGELLRLTAAMSTGAGAITTEGRVAGDTLVLDTSTVGKNSTLQVAWNRATGGFFAVEQSLRRQPMKPGEQRRLRSLLPIFNEVADVRLAAASFEATKLLEGTRVLLKIENISRLEAGQSIKLSMWVDRFGEVWKTELADLGQETFRTTRDVALSELVAGEFDLGEYSIVPVKRRLERAHRSTRIVYRVGLRDGDPGSLFVSCPTQQVRAIDRHTAELTVQAIRPEKPLAQEGAHAEPPGPQSLASTNLIQSDDPRVVAMASAVAPRELDVWRLAQALEAHVHQIIEAKNFSQAFASAAEVAETLEGDCTEHAVLLAALCRARNIPARVAIGLVYYPAQQAFAYHMWNEVWIKDRWIPLDATLGLGGIGAGHLKLAESSLHGATAYTAFFPVFRVIGRLTIEVVDVG